MEQKLLAAGMKVVTDPSTSHHARAKLTASALSCASCGGGLCFEGTASLAVEANGELLARAEAPNAPAFLTKVTPLASFAKRLVDAVVAAPGLKTYARSPRDQVHGSEGGPPGPAGTSE